ncbi:fibritin neck whiskers protein [Aeromonas phage Aswh_1]|nr:fibritin neck whiskers protein [Aeromonas phage Aswh_1]
MGIIKPSLDDLKFKSDVPPAGSGQQQVDWIKNGENPEGANPLIVGDKGGNLNRPSVQIEENVEILDLNQDKMLTKVNEIIDKVNIHDEIINAGDGMDLYERVDVLEGKATSHDQEIATIKETDILLDAQIRSISDNIGVGDPSLRFRTLRADDLHIKQMLGNYSGFDIDGMPSPGTLASGVKGQVERNYNTGVNLDVRVTSLEKWWEDSTPASLREEVNQIRIELGDDYDPTRTIYGRLSKLEFADEINTPLVEELSIHTGYGEFPLQYIDVETDTYVTVPNLYEYVIHTKKDIDYIGNMSKQTSNLADDLHRSLGSASDSNLDTTAWGRINDLRIRVSKNEQVLGGSPLDGLQGKVKEIDQREAEHFSNLDGRVSGISDTVNVEYRTAIEDLQNTVGNPSTGLYVKVEGTNSPADEEFRKKGVYRAAKEMFDGMYSEYKNGVGYVSNPSSQQLGAVWSREFDGTNWFWRDLFTTNFVVGDSKKITAIDGTALVSYSTGSDGNYIPTFGHTGATKIRIVGDIIGNLSLDTTSDLRKYGKILLGATDQTVKLGQNDKNTVLIGKDVNALKFGNGVDEYDVLHIGNYKSYITDINPEKGFTLEQDAKIGYAGADVIKLTSGKIQFGSSNANISFLSKIDNLIMDQSTSIKMNVGMGVNYSVVSNTSDSLIFGDTNCTNILAKDFYVQGPGVEKYRVWHQGMDAPADGSFYARKNNQWMVVTDGGGGGGTGGIDDAPQSGLPYVRVNDDGTGFWQAVGERDFTLAENVSILARTNGGVVTAMTVDAATVTTKIGANTGKLSLRGTVSNFLLDSKISTANGVLIEYKSPTGINIGDATSPKPVNVYGSLTVNSSRVWTDAIDAPNDANFYARKGGQWTLIHDGIDPDKDVSVNLNSDFIIGGYNVAKIDTVGADKLMTIGDSRVFVELAGKVTTIKLAEVGANRSFGISTTINNVSKNIISIEQPDTEKHIALGDSTLPTRISATEVTINNDKVLTAQSFEAPNDGNKYVRQSGQWVRAYYYGDFATDAPATPKEGDVFFEFIN